MIASAQDEVFSFVHTWPQDPLANVRRPRTYGSIIQAVNFETDEALLTGESLPARKDAHAIFPDATGPGDRHNVVYASSTVTKGRAKAIVFATCTYTEIGAIATALRSKASRVRPVKRRPDGSARPHRYLEAYTLTTTDAVGRFLGVNVGTPLQRKLSRLAILLFGVAVVCAIVVLGANTFSSRKEVVIYAVATGLSMIPASLVVVLTITMAAGTKRMVLRSVIVRNLKSLEALGSVTDICSDKTGTLTQGKMVARKAWIPALGMYTVDTSSEPFNPTVGDMFWDPRPPLPLDGATSDEGTGAQGSLEKVAREPAQLLAADKQGALANYLRVASLANVATIAKRDDGWHARGDPTEIAIQVFCARFDWSTTKLTGGSTAEWKHVAEFPFDSDVKRMSVVFQHLASDENVIFTKGAVERVLDACTMYCPEDGPGPEPVPLDPRARQDVLDNMTALAGMGLRVLALASREVDLSDTHEDKVAHLQRDTLETDLVFRGLIGLYDPPRPESASAVRSCHEAGISVHMLTGDHPDTARAIAVDVGILPKNMGRIRRDVSDAMVMTATQFDALSDDEVDQLPVLPLVVARCAPSTKVRMIEALHRRKKFCAMVSSFLPPKSTSVC